MSSSEGERVQCFVRYLPDVASHHGQLKHEVTLPGSTSVKELFDNVAKSMHLEPNSFKLLLQTKTEDKIFFEHTDGTLKSVGFHTGAVRNSLILEGIRGAPKPIKSEKEEENGGAGEGQNQITYPMPIPQPPPLSDCTSDFIFPGPLIRHNTGFVGLVNQAMTCYLNSLLQALYMTPEFRNALYNWKFNGKPTKPCIPLQLQKLFLNLQTSTRTAVETTELTKSFGWLAGEVWQQQDIQELCRVMFDALEHEFKETEQADLINRLYQGKMIDYVRCLECQKEKCREDTFLDIPLPVRPFGSTVAYGSINEALRAFVQPETLDGNNQYFCESCNKKCDAHKGLQFKKFPYLLTLHLKRFDFDYSTMNRIKLNDKVTFPKILDLNSFIKNNEESEEGVAEGIETSIKCDDSSTADSALDEDMNNVTEPQVHEIDQDEDEGIDLSSNSCNNHENEKNGQTKITGPFVYELYSIMIHSGSASGGHYYAYIKDFSKGEWYCFNDQSVTSITHEDIEKTYGGGPTRGYYSGAYSSSTNAYMLMYRQIDKEKNCLAMTEEQFPEHIKETLSEIRKAEEQEREKKAKQEERVKLKVLAANPLSANNCLQEVRIHLYNSDTLADATQLAYSELDLKRFVSEERCRLVFYNRETNQIEMSLDEYKNECLSTILNMKSENQFDFFMDVSYKNKPFLPYTLKDVIMSVHIVDPDKCIVNSTHQLRTGYQKSISDLANFFQKILDLESSEMHLVLSRGNNLTYLNKKEGNNLADVGFGVMGTQNEEQLTFRSHHLQMNKVFICPIGPEGDLSQNFESSQLHHCCSQLHNAISLYFVLPSESEVPEMVRNLLIPPLEEEKLSEAVKASELTPTSNENPINIHSAMNGVEEEAVFGGTSDQSTSEDSSLTDSERTIIGETQNDCQLSSASDSEQLSSPEIQSATIAKKPFEYEREEECWDESGIIKNYYFYATPYSLDPNNDELLDNLSYLKNKRILRVVVDVRMDLITLKSKLEKFIGVAGKYLKLTAGIDPDGGESFIGSLAGCRDDDKIVVTLQRVLNVNEVRAKIYRLTSNPKKNVRYLCDWFLMLGTTVGETKKAMLKELERRKDLKIPYDRFRLRRKSYVCAGKVLLDHEVWDQNMGICGASIELYVQALDKPEQVVNSSQMVISVRQWMPSSLELGDITEIVIDSPSVATFKQKVSEISNIPVEHIDFAQNNAFQEVEQPLLINKLNWNHDDSNCLIECEHLPEDDTIVYFRDKREEMKQLTREEQIKAKSLESSCFTKRDYTPNEKERRREKALKIYWSDEVARPRRSAIDVD